MEALTCAIYGGASYTNVNKLRYEMFLKSTKAIQIHLTFQMAWAYYHSAILPLKCTYTE